MQSEKMNIKIREAAENHHPAYDEKAWEKMEKLLDKHLPQKKDVRRRIIFFLLLFLLLGGGAATLFFAGKNPKDNPLSKAVTQPAAPVTNMPSSVNNETTGTEKNSTAITDVTKTPAGSNIPDNTTHAVNHTAISGTSAIPESIGVAKEQKKNTGITRVVGTKKTSSPPSATEGNKQVTGVDVKNNFQVPGLFDPAKAPDNNSIIAVTPALKNPETIQPAVDPHENIQSKSEINKPVHKEETTLDKSPAATTVKIKNIKRSSFSLNFSAGPDVSATSSGKPGKMKLLAGLGLGYTFKDRLSIRTGFYVADKVYTALPEDYHPPARFYYYYPNLEKIDASCRVYEIPVNLSYHFGHTAKQSWFVSSGVSSYLMKKEAYNYFYKSSPTSPTISRKRTMQGVNKHYFSVFNLSAGYQKNISKSVSVTVEPYIRVPLSGVGYGKVKLNSSGVLFTFGIKPFELFKKNPDARRK